MLLIGEKIHILNPAVYEAVKNRDTTPILKLAKAQIECGAHALDINLGPGRDAGSMLPDIIRRIQEEIDIVFSFPAAATSFPQAAQACQRRPIINAVSADRGEMERAMSAARCFDAELVVLLTRKGLLPSTVDQWCLVAEEVVETAEKNDFPLDKLYLDPVLRSHFDPCAPAGCTHIMESGPVCQALRLMKDLREEGIKTMAGLSNISQHMPYGTRSMAHSAMLNLLKTAGLDAVILNPLDRKLMQSISHQTLPSEKNTTGTRNYSAYLEELK